MVVKFTTMNVNQAAARPRWPPIGSAMAPGRRWREEGCGIGTGRGVIFLSAHGHSCGHPSQCAVHTK